LELRPTPDNSRSTTGRGGDGGLLGDITAMGPSLNDNPMAATETASSLPFAFAWATSAFADAPHTAPAAITGKGDVKSPDDAVASAREALAADAVVLPAGKLANPASCAEKEAWGERGSLI